MARTDLPASWDERTTLSTLLDYARATAVAKCEGLSDEHARLAPLPESPLMTMIGVLNHLRWVEHWWFEVMLLGREDQAPWTDEDPDREFRIAVEMPLEQVIKEYEDQCARVRTTVSDLDLDTMSERPTRSGTLVPLRWVMFHMLEETSRHNGHLDLLRELADGRTGR